MSDPILEKFCEFHEHNPLVWRLFQKFTFELINRGVARGSADAVLHRVRWETGAGDQYPDFKINNNFAAGYARMFARDFPQHRDFFRSRASCFDGALLPGELAQAEMAI